jgi:beta-glucanase (GH16 family)
MAKTGEIDILEYIGKAINGFTTLHTHSFGNSKNTKKTKIEGIENGFHTYGVDWTKIKWTFC